MAKTLPEKPPDGVKEAVQDILELKFDQPVQIDSGKPMTRHVFRFCVLDGPVPVPESIVAKHIDTRLANEWAGLQLLAECHTGPGPAPTPVFYGGDRNRGVIVLEDLGDDGRLDRIVNRGSPERAHRALVDFARCLGRIQGSAIGKRERFREIYESVEPGLRLTPADRRDYFVRLPPDYTMGTQDHLHEHYVEMFLNIAHHIDVTPHPDTERDLASIQSYFTDSDHPFLTWTHEDIYGVNVKYSGEDVKIFDFGLCQYRHALSDGIKCWTALDGWTNQEAVPEVVQNDMVVAYRTELGMRCSRANDDSIFYREVVHAAIVETVLGIYRRQSPEQLFEIKERSEQDQRVQDSRCWRLIHRCRLLSDLTASIRYLESIGETARRIEQKCHEFWPDHVFEIPLAGAFRER